MKVNIFSFIFFSSLMLMSADLSAESALMPIPNLTTGKISPICHELLDGRAPIRSFDQGMCVGIILGVEDNAHYDKKICVPKNIDIKERIRVVNSYIATQPTRTSEAFASLTFDALLKKWPCSVK